MSPILLFLLFLVIGFLAAFLIRCHQKKHYHKGPVKPSDLPAPPHHPLPSDSDPSQSQPSLADTAAEVGWTFPRILVSDDAHGVVDDIMSHIATNTVFCLGFVAVDADGSIFIYDRMPVRDQERKAWYPRPDDYPSDRGCFEANFLRPNVPLTWDDEPRLCCFTTYPTYSVTSIVDPDKQ